LTREAAYDLVQRNAMLTWRAKHEGRDDADFLRQLRLDPEVNKHFAAGELEKLCSLDFHWQNIGAKFENVFGASTSIKESK
jgi:adenylosuccinate lyase